MASQDLAYTLAKADADAVEREYLDRSVPWVEREFKIFSAAGLRILIAPRLSEEELQVPSCYPYEVSRCEPGGRREAAGLTLWCRSVGRSVG